MSDKPVSCDAEVFEFKRGPVADLCASFGLAGQVLEMASRSPIGRLTSAVATFQMECGRAMAMPYVDPNQAMQACVEAGQAGQRIGHVWVESVFGLEPGSTEPPAEVLHIGDFRRTACGTLIDMRPRERVLAK